MPSAEVARRTETPVRKRAVSAPRRYLVPGIVAAALALASCAPTPTTETSTTDGVATRVSPETYQKIYRESIETFGEPLPAGIDFPAQARADGDMLDVQAEAEAFFYWRCAWVAEYLEHYDKPTTSTAEAVAMLSKNWTSLQFARDHVAAHDTWNNEIFGAAELGDLANLREYFDGTCTWYETVNPDEG